MGQHYVNFDLVGIPRIDPLRPEALVYEPRPTAGYKLVALDSGAVGCLARGQRRPTVSAARCSSGRRRTATASSPDFYERHYWLCKPTRAGAFDDWNPNVSCRGHG